MQLTAVKMDNWFFFGNSKLLKKDTEQDQKQHANLINPAVAKKIAANNEAAKKEPGETGYKNSERAALENQLLQIETSARAHMERDKNQK